MPQFSERFTVNNSAFSASVADINAATEAQLVLSPELVGIAQMVRRNSILLKSVTLKEIYLIITQSTDPEIALILLASKNNDNSYRFTEETVRDMLWGKPNSPLAGFTDGLREITSRLAAAILIVAYATQPFQQATSEYLRKYALESLEKIIALHDKINTSASPSTTEASDSARFYFQPFEYTSESILTVSFFIPNFRSNPDWIKVADYPAGTQISTRRIAADLAYAINRYTLNPQAGTNIIAAASQAGAFSNHFVDFNVRSLVTGFVSEVISVRIEYAANPELKLPFNWGVTLTDLKPYTINSRLLILKSPKESKLSTVVSSSSVAINRTVLYFRNAPVLPTVISNIDLTYRLSVSEENTHRVEIPVSTDPRYSQAALAFTNSLHTIRAKSKLLGAIIRNDPLTASIPLAAVELIAWSATNPEIKLILDLLSIPQDIEIALGDEVGPITQFSSHPLTAIATPIFHRYINQSLSTANSSSNEGCVVVAIGSDSQDAGLAARTKEISRRITGHHYG